MTSIASRARQILYRRYPDGWLHAGFALLLGTFLGVLALVFTRGQELTSHFVLVHALPRWILSLGFFVGAVALLTARRWGLALLGVIYAVVAIFFIQVNSIFGAVYFGAVAWSYYNWYRRPEMGKDTFSSF